MRGAVVSYTCNRKSRQLIKRETRTTDKMRYLEHMCNKTRSLRDEYIQYVLNFNIEELPT